MDKSLARKWKGADPKPHGREGGGQPFEAGVAARENGDRWSVDREFCQVMGYTEQAQLGLHLF